MTITADFTLEWFQPDERSDGREDSCWYTFGHGHDAVVSVSRGDQTISIYADGEMDIRVYERQDNGFQEVGRVRYFDQLSEYGITTDEDLWGLNPTDDLPDTKGPNKAGYYFEFINNSWFDLYEGEDGEHLDAVSHTLSDAISQAIAIITEESK